MILCILVHCVTVEDDNSFSLPKKQNIFNILKELKLLQNKQYLKKSSEPQLLVARKTRHMALSWGKHANENGKCSVKRYPKQGL